MTKIIKSLWAHWLKIGHIIGNFQGQLILTIFYFIFLWPLGIIFKFFQDPLKTKNKRAHTTFSTFVYEDSDINSARRQY